jgi:hypothetical protein
MIYLIFKKSKMKICKIIRKKIFRNNKYHKFFAEGSYPIDDIYGFYIGKF